MLRRLFGMYKAGRNVLTGNVHQQLTATPWHLHRRCSTGLSLSICVHDAVAGSLVQL
jgi:hypothetical protein